MRQYFVFTLDQRLYALRLHAVERAFRAVEITPLPGAPEVFLGVVNIAGRIVPVMNLRKRFRLPQREISVSDILILARTSRREVALWADEVKGVLEKEEAEEIEGASVAPGADFVEGIIKVNGDITLIHDLDRFLSLDEARSLESALGRES